MKECRGSVFNSTLKNISDQDTDDSSCEVEICQAQTHSTLTENSYKQLPSSVSGINGENTVASETGEVAVVMSEFQLIKASAQPEDLGIILE